VPGNQITLLVGASSEIGGAILHEFRAKSEDSCFSLGRSKKSDCLAIYENPVEATEGKALFEGNLISICQYMNSRNLIISKLILSSGYMSQSFNQSDPGEFYKSFEGNTLFPISVFEALIDHEILKKQSLVILMSSSLYGLPLQEKHFVYQLMKELLEKFMVHEFRSKNLEMDLLVVRPGHVQTKLNALIPESKISTNANNLASFLSRQKFGQAKGPRYRVCYYPRSLRFATFTLRLLPKRVFRLLIDLLKSGD